MTMLPDNWIGVDFGELNCFSSKSINPATSPEELFELYSVPSFPTGIPEMQPGASIGSTKQAVEPGDVLVCKINPRINRVWKVGTKQNQRQIASSEWIVMRAPEVDSRFFRYFFSSPAFREFICKDVTGVGGSLTRAQPKRIAAFPIPLAPLPEQIRIADKLDAILARVDACRERLDHVPSILKRFRQSVLAVATSGKLTEEWREVTGCSEAWRSVRLDEIAEIQGGVTKDTKKQSDADHEVPYLRVANVQRGYLDLAEVKTIRVPASKLGPLLLEPGDVLFNEGGDIDKLGRGWIWEGQIERCTFQNHVFRVRLFDKSNQPKYISCWGNHRGLNYFLRGGKQTTNLASINKSMLSALPISLPPSDEQHEIVRRVETLFAYADRLEAHYAAARTQVDKLTPALLAKAFQGELVPQDPNDEPASLLLERIRAARAATPAKPKSRKASGGEKRQQKAEDTMLNRKDIADTHLTMILRERGPLTAEALWSASQLDIDDFYDQLKDEETRGLLKEKRSDVLTAPRMLEAAA